MGAVKLLAALESLSEGCVEFIVVGGISAVLNGAIVDTLDLDIVHRRTPANVSLLLTVLESIDAHYRLQPERHLRPGMSHLSSTGHSNLLTTFGPLDVLGTVGSGLDYEALLPHSTEVEVRRGLRVRVLNLDKLIEIKEQLGSEKDRAVLPLLRSTLEQRRK